MSVHLGFNQYNALERLYDSGSPVTLEQLEEPHPGTNEIVDLRVTYFADDEVTRLTAVITRDGDTITEEEYAKERET